MARVRISKTPKALSGFEVKMRPGLYGTNGNRQFTLPNQVNSQRFSQQPIDVRDTLQPVARDGANLEAEKGETAMVNIDGVPAHFKIGGKRHSKGGTPLNLPDNSFIFSDTAKMKIKDPMIHAQFGMVPKKSGYTPAEIAKKYDINTFRKILADPNSEDIERKTAEAMISNYNMKLAKLALVQESMKGFPQGIPAVAMPYVMANDIKPEELFETQGQEEQPDADMGVSRYGGNMVSQFNTKQYGGLPRAQVGVINKPATPSTGTTTASSYNVPLQVNPKDIQYTEPDWGSKVLEGVGAVFEFPQRAAMYAGTGLLGDDYYEMYNPYTNKKEMVHEKNVNQWKKSGYAPTGVKTGFSDRAHYEMPGETLKRTFPESSPALQFAADVFVDPLLPISVWKTAGRVATKGISKAVTKAVYKDELLNLSRPDAIEKILTNAKKTSNNRNKKIASDVLDKVENAYKNAPDIDERGLYKIAAPAAHNAAIFHDAKKVNEKVVEKTTQLVNATKSRAKKIYEGAAPIVKKAIKGTKDVVVAAHNAIDDPIAGPAAKNLLRNMATQGSRYVHQSQKEKERKLKEEELSEWQSAGVDATNKVGLFTNPKRGTGKFYFDKGIFKPYTPQVQDSLNLLVKKPAKKYIQTSDMTKDEFLKSIPLQDSIQNEEPDFESMTVEEIDKWLEKNK